MAQIDFTGANERQREFLTAVLRGKNVMLTGVAGTGKSWCVSKLESLRAVFFCGMTGMAAAQLSVSDATTLHRYLGLFPCPLNSENDVARAVRDYVEKPHMKKYALRRMRFTHTLVIDEVSMMLPGLLHATNRILQVARQTQLPFGGVQVILCGDFMQLDPVKDTKAAEKRARDEAVTDFDHDFIFQTDLFKSSEFYKVQLTEQMRQSKDTVFADALSRLRVGRHTLSDVALFNSRILEPPPNTPRIFPLKREVDAYNQRILASLPGNVSTHVAKYVVQKRMIVKHADGQPDEEVWLQVEDNSVAQRDVDTAKADLVARSAYDETLQFKENSTVMYLKNDPNEGLHNGTIGRVVKGESFPLGDEDDPNADRYQTWDFVYKVMDTVLRKKEDSDEYIEVQKEVEKRITLGTCAWERNIDPDTRVVAWQFPITLADAMTIHKIQGSTLDCVCVDVSRCFAFGHEYVAMSRVRSIEQLYLSSPFPSPGRVRVHQAALEYYRT
jgi:hypothetical protein